MGLRDDSWLVIRPATVALVVGDLLVIGALVAWGLSSHSVSAIDRPFYAIRTAAPFLVGWLIMGPIAGAFSSRALHSSRSMVLAAGAAWLGAALIGVAIRATPLLPGGAAPTFVLVMVATGLAVMIPWRVFVTVVTGRLDIWSPP